MPDWCYGALCDQWLGDRKILEFLNQRNPWVLRDMAERLLEASNRGLWQGARNDQIERLKQHISASESLIERGDLTC